MSKGLTFNDDVTVTIGETALAADDYEVSYETAADGTYYMLKDGTYTTEAPNGNEDLYDSTSKKYKLVDKVTEDVTKEQVTAEGYVNENGVLTIEGLNAGTYTITELAAPEGYNLLNLPIELVVNSVVDQDTKTCDWSATVDGENAAIENNVIKLTVKNNQGSELPSTGGIGTTLFYVLGGMLVLSACVILITRKRVNAEA